MDTSPRRRAAHVVVIPWMAQGHFIPMIDIARLLAERGSADVTVITTPGNAARISATISRLSASGLPLRFATLPFPSIAAGLPDGCENLDSIPSRDMARNFYDGAKLLRRPLEDLLRRHPRPTCILSGIGFPWLHSIAKELAVPRLVFQGFSSFSLLASHALHQAAAPPPELLIPGIPHRVEIKSSQLPKCFDCTSKFGDIYSELREGETTADGFVINSFEELEPLYAGMLERETGRPAWSIGPVSLASCRERMDAAERGNTPAVGEEECHRWLDSAAEAGSVVYVSFGSMGRMGIRQLIEMGLGLERAGWPVVWAAAEAEMDTWMSEEGFQERMNGRCLLIRGWAPQVAVLSHPAVGGFVTHCGWNSAIEGVTAGVPLLTWPLGAEQFLNEKMLVEVVGWGGRWRRR